MCTLSLHDALPISPSFRPEALPAVTVPSLSKAGRRPASASALVFLLMNSSFAKTIGSPFFCERRVHQQEEDRKSTPLNSSHRCNSYAVFCLKKKTTLGGMVELKQGGWDGEDYCFYYRIQAEASRRLSGPQAAAETVDGT